MAYNLKNFQGYENQGKTKEILFQTETWQLNVVCNSEWSLGIKDDIRLNGKPGIGSEELVECIDVKFPSKNGWTVVMWDNVLVCRKHTLKYFEWQVIILATYSSVVRKKSSLHCSWNFSVCL